MDKHIILLRKEPDYDIFVDFDDLAKAIASELPNVKDGNIPRYLYNYIISLYLYLFVIYLSIYINLITAIPLTCFPRSLFSSPLFSALLFSSHLV